jgi:hypothetical protein
MPAEYPIQAVLDTSLCTSHMLCAKEDAGSKIQLTVIVLVKMKILGQFNESASLRLAQSLRTYRTEGLVINQFLWE